MTRTKIMLADDHVLVRKNLSRFLKEELADIEIIGEASNGIEMIELLNSRMIPDILVLDLNMPRMDGFESAAYLKKNHPAVKIMVLSMYESEIAVIRLMQFGVRCVMKKDILPDNLLEAFRSVNKNGYYFCSATTGKLALFFSKEGEGAAGFEKDRITEDDIRFLRLTASDLTYKEIATELGISARAADTVRDTLFEKLDVKSRVGLAIYAMKHGIISF